MDFKVGDIVICIKEPHSDEYTIPIGFISKITDHINPINLTPTPLQLPQYRGIYHKPCFRKELFVLVKDLTKLEKAFYNIP